MINCVFCKIIKGELPSNKIYEDKDFFAFLDIYPRTEGHTLVIPKKHYRWVYDVPNFDEYWLVVLKITEAMKKAFKTDFVTYVTHGLEVPHAHIHIMPRHEETEFIPPIKKFSPEKMKEIAEKIKKEII